MLLRYVELRCITLRVFFFFFFLDYILQLRNALFVDNSGVKYRPKFQ